jgi:hypothetical protein
VAEYSSTYNANLAGQQVSDPIRTISVDRMEPHTNRTSKWFMATSNQKIRHSLLSVGYICNHTNVARGLQRLETTMRHKPRPDRRRRTEARVTETHTRGYGHVQRKKQYRMQRSIHFQRRAIGNVIKTNSHNQAMATQSNPQSKGRQRKTQTKNETEEKPISPKDTSLFPANT